MVVPRAVRLGSTGGAATKAGLAAPLDPLQSPEPGHRVWAAGRASFCAGRKDSRASPLDPRRRRSRSQPPPASIAAEVTSHLLGRCPPAHLVDFVVLEDRLAVDGILEPFEGPSRCSIRASSASKAPLPTDPRLQGLIAAGTGCALGWHCPGPPDPLVGYSRERKRERDPAADAAGPAGLDHLPQAPRLGAIALRWPSGSGGSPARRVSSQQATILPFRARTTGDAHLPSAGDMHARPMRCAWGNTGV